MTIFYIAAAASLWAASVVAQPDSVRYAFPTTIVNATRSAQPAAGLPYALSVVGADTLGTPRPAVW